MNLKGPLKIPPINSFGKSIPVKFEISRLEWDTPIGSVLAGGGDRDAGIPPRAPAFYFLLVLLGEIPPVRRKFAMVPFFAIVSFYSQMLLC